MENVQISNDITVYCITATSYPEGVLEAHQQLHALVPFSPQRHYFGISCPNQKGIIIYKSAATELVVGDLSTHGLSPFIIPKGYYACITIQDFRKNIADIGTAFQNILHSQQIDPQGFCLEWYQGQNDVRCMVRLRD